MAIPDYQSCMLPLLRLAGDGEVHSMREAVEKLSDEFDLSAEERAEVLPSGSQFVMANRVGWARTYIKKAGLLSDPKRGHFQITERGRELLHSNPSEINTKTLRQYDSFVEFQTKSSPRTSSGASATEAASYPTPQEALEYGYEKLTENLSDELLENVMACSSAFFERLVVQLLVAMGYGYDRPWRMRSWDRFAVPRPFSRARAVPSGEIFIPPDLDRDGLEHFRGKVEALLSALTLEAEVWAASGQPKLGQRPLDRRGTPLRSERGNLPITLTGPHFPRATLGTQVTSAGSRIGVRL